jgi:hypothetical protein
VDASLLERFLGLKTTSQKVHNWKLCMLLAELGTVNVVWGFFIFPNISEANQFFFFFFHE